MVEPGSEFEGAGGYHDCERSVREFGTDNEETGCTSREEVDVDGLLGSKGEGPHDRSRPPFSGWECRRLIDLRFCFVETEILRNTVVIYPVISLRVPN